MEIAYTHSILVAAPPEKTYAFLDDLPKTPLWLDRCLSLEKLSEEPNQVGTKLRYTFREGSRTGTMEGEILERTPGETLSCRYRDAMMDVLVVYRVEAAASWTRLTHTIEIVPQTFFGKLLSPFIRRQLPKQTTGAMEKLKGLLEEA